MAAISPISTSDATLRQHFRWNNKPKLEVAPLKMAQEPQTVTIHDCTLELDQPLLEKKEPSPRAMEYAAGMGGFMALQPGKRIEMQFRPTLPWTSETFDMVLTLTECRKTTVYLFDFFTGPANNTSSSSDLEFLLRPVTRQFLTQKLFRLTATGLRLKDKYRQCPVVTDWAGSPFGIPITEELVQLLLRDYYFNFSYNYIVEDMAGNQRVDEMRVIYQGITTALPFESRMLENLLHSNNLYSQHYHVAPIGPSWLCTLSKMTFQFDQLRQQDPYKLSIKVGTAVKALW